MGQSAGYEVGWQSEGARVSLEKIDPRLKILQEKITYTCDEKLFLLYAFLNYTGLDDENGDT